ncbi:hypothetical protein [Inhella proteolytica]|nr:hypothetical protein [Inhella proteolytica]
MNCPAPHLYALQVQVARTPANGVAGSIEHVLSGRRHSFASVTELVSWLLQEQALQATRPAATPAAASNSPRRRRSDREDHPVTPPFRPHFQRSG